MAEKEERRQQLDLVDTSSSSSTSTSSFIKTVMKPPLLHASTQLTLQLSSESEANGGSCNHDDANHAKVVMERPASDGYSWRKYGQKRVKSTEISRSYYRCTACACEAKKKVQHSQHSGHVVDIVYVGNHNHDPPQQRCIRSRMFIVAGGNAAAAPAESYDVSPTPVPELDGSFLSLSLTNHGQPSPHTPESKSLSSSSSVGNVTSSGVQKVDSPKHKQLLEPQRNGSHEFPSSDFGDKVDVESCSKRRMIERCAGHVSSCCRRGKEPQFVVHAVADNEAVRDGYRWRKYGQKMVKGNLYPRSYYRCTATGCPVRRHIERAEDDPQSFIVTYEGKHNHDMPGIDKLHGTPASPTYFVNATASRPDKQCQETKTSAFSMEQPPEIEGHCSSKKIMERPAPLADKQFAEAESSAKQPFSMEQALAGEGHCSSKKILELPAPISDKQVSVAESSAKPPFSMEQALAREGHYRSKKILEQPAAGPDKQFADAEISVKQPLSMEQALVREGHYARKKILEQPAAGPDKQFADAEISVKQPLSMEQPLAREGHYARKKILEQPAARPDEQCAEAETSAKQTYSKGLPLAGEGHYSSEKILEQPAAAPDKLFVEVETSAKPSFSMEKPLAGEGYYLSEKILEQTAARPVKHCAEAKTPAKRPFSMEQPLARGEHYSNKKILKRTVGISYKHRAETETSAKQPLPMEQPLARKSHYSSKNILKEPAAGPDKQCTDAETLSKQSFSMEEPLAREGHSSSEKVTEKPDEAALELAQCLLSMRTEIRGC